MADAEDPEGSAVSVVEEPPPPPTPPPPPPPCVKIMEDGWGNVRDPVASSPAVVRRYTMTSPSGLSVQLVSYGAAVVRVRAPDKRGVLHDVMLCAENLHDYIKYQKLIGSGVRGRVANRIWRGRFRMDGLPVFVSRNDGKHCCHGGFWGFDKVVWQSRVVDDRVVMTHLSAAGDEGFPGSVLVLLVFRLTLDDILVVDMQARCDRPTPIDLRYGLFLNLAGHDTGEKGLLEHTLTINSTKYFASTEDNHASGHLLDSLGTRFDFLEPHSLRDRLHKIARGGYDHTYFVNVYPPGELSFVARLEHARSGRVLEVYSDQPTVHVSTGRYLPEAPWQEARALPMPKHEPMLPCPTYEAWPWPQPFLPRRSTALPAAEDDFSEPTTPPLKKASSVWSAHTCSVILSSSSGSSCEWPIAKPRNRWDKATSTSSLARMLEVATSTHLSFRDRTTSMSPLKPPPIDLLGGGDVPLPPEPPPDPDEVAAERLRELEQRWEEEDQQWQTEEHFANGTGRCPIGTIGGTHHHANHCGFQNMKICTEKEEECKRIPGINGVLYYRFGGIELATQGFPDAVNRGQFPSCILRPGEVYKRTTVYYFSTLPKTEVELKEEREKEKEAETRQMEAEEARLAAEVKQKLEEIQAALAEIPEEPEE